MSQPATSKSREDARYALHKAVVLYGADLVGSHPWAWEIARWKELVFSFLTRVSRLPEKVLRNLTNRMQDLGLLEIETLASLSRAGKGSAIEQGAYGRRIMELLQESGLSQEESRQGLTTICEAALVLQDQYEGKIQKYLRSYGELMLKELDGIFKFSVLSKADVADAFTYWFQNVLNMPLSLADENVRLFCEKHNLQPRDLIDEADNMGFNLGYVDDVAYYYNVKHQQMAEQ